MKYLIGSCSLNSSQLITSNTIKAANFSVAGYCQLGQGRSSIYAVNYPNAYAVNSVFDLRITPATLYLNLNNVPH